MSTIEVQNSAPVQSPPETSTSGSIAPIPLAQSSAGRVSGKSWKIQKTATVYVTIVAASLVDCANLGLQSIKSSGGRQVKMGRTYGEDEEGKGCENA